MNNKFKNVPFWQLALKLGLIFILIVMFIQLIWEWIKVGNLSFITDGFNNGEWVNYVGSKLILGFVYGIVSAFFLKRNKSKK